MRPVNVLVLCHGHQNGQQSRRMFSLLFVCLSPWRAPGRYGASSRPMMASSGFRCSPRHAALGDATIIASTTKWEVTFGRPRGCPVMFATRVRNSLSNCCQQKIQPLPYIQYYLPQETETGDYYCRITTWFVTKLGLYYLMATITVLSSRVLGSVAADQRLCSFRNNMATLLGTTYVLYVWYTLCRD